MNGLQVLTLTGLLTGVNGIVGISRNRESLLLTLICVEMMLFGLNLYLVAVSLLMQEVQGMVFSLYVVVVAAAESAVALGILAAWLRVFGDTVATEY